MFFYGTAKPFIMKKRTRTIFLSLFTVCLFTFYYQLFSFSSHRTCHIERSYDTDLSVTKTHIILIPTSEQDFVDADRAVQAPKYLLKAEENAFLQIQTKYFSFVLKL